MTEWGTDFEQDTATIREWINGGAVNIERLTAELRAALDFFGEDE